MVTAHIVAYRRILLGGHHALCGKLMRDSRPGMGDAKRVCPKCTRLWEAKTGKKVGR